MARAYAGVLSVIALGLSIVRGLWIGMLPDEILSQSLVVFFAFALLGYAIGYGAEQTVCDSVENRFRSEMARLQPAAAEENSEKPSEL